MANPICFHHIANIPISIRPKSQPMRKFSFQYFRYCGNHNIYPIRRYRHYSLLDICDNAGVTVQIRTVLTGVNCNTEELTKLYSFLAKHPSVSEWDITPVFLSANKPDYPAYYASFTRFTTSHVG